jgi:magnesium-transporting ATPase (P-type)
LPQRINISANIKIFVFDKTGTLTEDGMKIFGIKQNIGNQLEDING